MPMMLQHSVADIPDKGTLGIQGIMHFGFSFIRNPQFASQAPQPFCEVWRIFSISILLYTSRFLS